MDITREDVRRQLDLEAESRALGAARYDRSRPMPWKTGAAEVAAEEEANLPPGQHLLRMAVMPTAEAIREFIAKANEGGAGRRHSSVKWLELSRPEEVAYITVRAALNHSVKATTIQSAAIAVANAIIDHVDMVTFKSKNKAGYAGYLKSSKKSGRTSAKHLNAIRKMLANEESRSAIPAREKLLLGHAAIELLIEATGLFTKDMVPRHGGRIYVLRPTEAVQKWLSEQHSRSALLDPVLLPMVIRPRRWRNPRAGGYLRRVYGRPLVKGGGRTYQDLLATTDLSAVYEAINHIQETPWRVNKRLLDVMREAWDGGGSFAGLPARDDKPLPGKPEGMEEDEEKLRDWKRRAAMVHEENAKLLTQRLATQQRLWIGERFAAEPTLFFPHAMDFRGRVYPIPATALHPQADDPGKALLEFAHGLPLGKTGAYWLAVHIANLFGVDKVSFRERVEWTWANAEKLIDSALYPLDGDRFWLTADSPWSALAAAFEFAAFLEQGETYVSHLPIPVDGSNSGLQHFSAMLRDPIGAAAVNLVPSDKPSDVYLEVAARAQSRVDADTNPAAAPWKGGKVTRKIAKRPTMTFVYSATRFGMQDMILETLRELDNEGTPYLGGADNYASANYLSYILFEAVSEVVNAAAEAMAWLREVAKVASDAGVALTWTAPDGLPIRQDYRVPFGTRVAIHWRGQRLQIVLAQEGSQLDGRGQANGIAPNFVHSLDAAHLRALARAAKAEGIEHLGVIHDSFATHAARTDDLSRLLRETFVEQYRPDVLARFRDEVVAALPEEWKPLVPEPPSFGSLELEEVLASPYLFA